jgi:hypothetical protein
MMWADVRVPLHAIDGETKNFSDMARRMQHLDWFKCPITSFSLVVLSYIAPRGCSQGLSPQSLRFVA